MTRRTSFLFFATLLLGGFFCQICFSDDIDYDLTLKTSGDFSSDNEAAPPDTTCGAKNRDISAGYQEPPLTIVRGYYRVEVKCHQTFTGDIYDLDIKQERDFRIYWIDNELEELIMEASSDGWVDDDETNSDEDLTLSDNWNIYEQDAPGATAFINIPPWDALEVGERAYYRQNLRTWVRETHCYTDFAETQNWRHVLVLQVMAGPNYDPDDPWDVQWGFVSNLASVGHYSLPD